MAYEPTNIDWRAIPDDVAKLGMDFAVQQARHVADRIEAETERWIWKAFARGPGWTVWRSDPNYEIGAMKHDFMLVPPGGGHPAGGVRLGLKVAE